MDKIAVFDVDYTLTKSETQVEFLRYLIGRDPGRILALPRSIWGALGYLLKIHDEKKAKELNLKLLHGLPMEQVNRLTRSFFDDRLRHILYKDAVKAMKHYHNLGYRVILNSASPEIYIKEFERLPYVEKAIGTRFVVENEKFVSKVLGQNNKGKAKVPRLLAYLGDEPIDFGASVTFSDSLSDVPLFALTGQAYLVNHKQTKDYPTLIWR